MFKPLLFAGVSLSPVTAMSLRCRCDVTELPLPGRRPPMVPPPGETNWADFKKRIDTKRAETRSTK